jgi:hypothetical protein
MSRPPTGEALLADTLLYEHTDNIISHSSSTEAQWPKVFNLQELRGQSRQFLTVNQQSTRM